MAETIREPKQQRSIEKKKNIIRAGYELFAEKGYFNTNTAEIAKRAGVSTGIVYGYFHDKRDILLDVLDIYIADVFNPVLALFDEMSANLNLQELVPNIIEKVVETHKEHASIHEALHSLTSTDPIVEGKFKELEEEMTTKIADALKKHGYNQNDLIERVHTAIGIYQSFSHEVVFDDHPYINYDNMREITIKLIISLFE